MASLAGQTFEKYDVIEEVGHGGMAVVYRARDRVLDREVAIKVLHAHLADREESRQRLRREAITVAKLRHENIVEIYDYSGVEGDDSFIVTEFIHGLTLRNWLDTRWHPRPALAALVIHRLCLALIPAHELGIVHRDIKPENVMVRDDGKLKLMDFGIAQILDHQKLTMTGQLLGSPAYMAPELISGRPVDARTDLFAVGIMLYQLATAQLPFQGRNPHEVLNRIADCQYPPAASVNPKVDEELEAIIRRSLSREPQDRYASARAFANDLEDYLAGLGVDPDAGVLEAYFGDPEARVDQLDASVVAHLLDRAEAASNAGHGPRALKLLGRVLEYAPDDRRAKALLDAARLRGHRMRQLLLIGASVAVFGLVTAGVVLMRMPPGPLQLAAERSGARDGHAGAAVRTDASRPDVRTSNARPDREPGDRSGDPTDPDRRRDPAQTGPGTSGAAADDDEGDDDTGRAGGRPSPRAESGVTRPRSSRPVECVVQVEGLPAPYLAHHGLSVAGGPRHPYDRQRKGYLVPIVGDNDVAARLDGDRYAGRKTLSRAACEAGPVAMTATPRPIRLELSDAVFKPREVLVRCVPPSRCKSALAHEWSAILAAGQTSASFTLALSDAKTGFFTATVSRELYPGPNKVAVQLVDSRE